MDSSLHCGFIIKQPLIIVYHKFIYSDSGNFSKIVKKGTQREAISKSLHLTEIFLLVFNSSGYVKFNIAKKKTPSG